MTLVYLKPTNSLALILTSKQHSMFNHSPLLLKLMFFFGFQGFLYYGCSFSAYFITDLTYSTKPPVLLLGIGPFHTHQSNPLLHPVSNTIPILVILSLHLSSSPSSIQSTQTANRHLHFDFTKVSQPLHVQNQISHLCITPLWSFSNFP